MGAAPSVHQIRETLRRHAAELSDRKVAALSVFGSMARATASDDSDIDLIVEFDESRRPTLFDSIALEQYLREVFGRDVDIVEKDALKPRVLRRVEQDAVQVF